MELVSQIINDLIDDSKSLNSALLKTKVLANRIQSIELLNWASKELTGYSDNRDLPQYRKAKHAYLKGDYIQGNNLFKNADIPTDGLENDLEKKLLLHDFSDSIKSLESLISKNNPKIGFPLNPTIVAFLESNIQNNGNPYFQLLNVNKIASTTIIVEILSNVRDKLLDFMLEIDKQFDNITEIRDLKMKSEEIKSIVNNTIIQGDGNVLNTGEKANIKNINKINKSNKTDLISALKDNGVSDGDISELVEIIDQEEPISETSMGPVVNKWIGKMLNKAIDGSWNIGIGAAGGVLVEIIKQYYGM
ncbi:AbiTii domain-containing protein [Flavobacterium psychrotrophum]|uniref:AbiTii domain-containing protein n=1 Tax=Flavobacterium psychrotrophum TaxID=2294119 RepID=UPI000E313568|nr:hypothetical protein [Flavobacterium psychrotrophum]